LRWYKEKVERYRKQQEQMSAALCDRIMMIEEQCEAALAQAEVMEQELFRVEGELFMGSMPPNASIIHILLNHRKPRIHNPERLV
jgi:hypothetical protein